MPIYEYQCTKCEHQLEALQKMDEKPLRKCPECGKAGLTKLVSAASFRLKGGGWYETDFKTGNKKQLAESESAAPSSDNSAKSGNSKSDSSPSKDAAKSPVAKEAAKSSNKDSKKKSSKASSS